MSDYVVELTEDELGALYTVAGYVPFEDETSSLAKIFYYINDNDSLYISNDIYTCQSSTTIECTI
jgi:hypothetical protein